MLLTERLSNEILVVDGGCSRSSSGSFTLVYDIRHVDIVLDCRSLIDVGLGD